MATPGQRRQDTASPWRRTEPLPWHPALLHHHPLGLAQSVTRSRGSRRLPRRDGSGAAFTAAAAAACDSKACTRRHTSTARPVCEQGDGARALPHKTARTEGPHAPPRHGRGRGCRTRARAVPQRLIHLPALCGWCIHIRPRQILQPPVPTAMKDGDDASGLRTQSVAVVARASAAPGRRRTLHAGGGACPRPAPLELWPHAVAARLAYHSPARSRMTRCVYAHVQQRVGETRHPDDTSALRPPPRTPTARLPLPFPTSPRCRAAPQRRLGGTFLLPVARPMRSLVFSLNPSTGDAPGISSLSRGMGDTR